MQLISLSNSIEDFVKFVRLFIRTNKRTHTIPYNHTIEIPYKDIPDFLPYPLKVISHEFGNFPLSYLFGYQDSLVDFHDLKIKDEKITFALEHQGAWEAKTEAYKVDPPVYLESGLYKKEIADQLSNFLITFCLRELMEGANYSYSTKYEYKNELMQLLDNSQPVWLNGKAIYDEPYSFYLTEDNLLLLVKGHVVLVASNELHNSIVNSKTIGNLISLR